MSTTKLVTISAIVAITALTACSGSSSSPSARTATPKTKVNAACSGTPVQGGNVVYERGNETLTLNPISIRNGNGDIFADALIYEGLVRYDPKGSTNVEGAIAKAWTVSPDGLTYTFALRPGVKFSNGQPVTAEDVKFSLDRFGDVKIDQVMAPVAIGYKSSQIIDSSTIAITLSEPVPAFLDNISIFPAFVVPKALVQAQGDKFWVHPVGSGPFVVKDFVSGSHITFVRNPYYWDTGKPYLDSVTFNFATDANSRLLALTSGAGQIADTITPSEITSINNNPNLALQSVNLPGWISLHPNEKYKPLADVKVRLAMATAIDRATINKDIFSGLGAIPNSVFGPLKLDGTDSLVAPYSFDLAKAKRLMSESGYPNGFTVKMEYPSGLDYFNQLALLLKQQLAAININVNLVQETAATMATNLSAYTFQLSFGYTEVTSDIAVPDEYASFYANPNSGTNGFFTSWADSTIAAQVAKFASETSEAARATEWPQIQQAFMEQQPTINILDLPFLNAHAKNVCGTDVNDLGVDVLQDTWISPDSTK